MVSDGLDWVAAAGLVVADAFLVSVVLVYARRGADKLGAATFGIRRTAFWPAVGWMVLAYFAVSVFNVLWLTWSAPAASRARSAAAVRRRSRRSCWSVIGVAVAAPIVRGDRLPRLSVPGARALARTVDRGAARRRGLRRRALLVYPPQLLPLMAAFGFAACMLFWFTGSLLPCIALHAMNNALVTGIELGWSWGVPLLMLGCMALALLVLAPFARERAPQLA